MLTLCKCRLYLIEGYGVIAGPLGHGILHTRKSCQPIEGEITRYSP